MNDKAKTLTNTILRDDVYAFIFGQKGLMTGLGIQGSKITKLSKQATSGRSAVHRHLTPVGAHLMTVRHPLRSSAPQYGAGGDGPQRRLL
jgi:hypothetical protein